MSFDLYRLSQLCDAHDTVARVVVADVKGSTPRDIGAEMFVWSDGQRGSIGGGALEHEATSAARDALSHPARPQLHRIPLGPNLGQCCGGAVSLVTEVFTAQTLPTGPIFARRVAAQASAHAPDTLGLAEGWLIEELTFNRTPIWIWGAGHVGRALAATLAPMPDFDVTLIDTCESRMPPAIENVTPLVAANMPRAAQYAPATARHLIMTYDHAIDLALCAALLNTPHKDIGLIGSATKWARFKRRLGDQGFKTAQINSIACPIGDPNAGKHPQAIAISVAAALLLVGQNKKHASDSQIGAA
ncbi:xanthine dehydrogenase accessory protein XdhC [Falsihalocynthiibacter sp. SS001]|uniref:xanthine dehydrogenase accessory protein XdhC n=1 Tax=Falsihalocynthiibacter sp. SS001 TaxID=3349698 RepID=UPI0036D3CC80